MKYRFLTLLLFASYVLSAQKVSNITFRQEQSYIIVSYDLYTKTPCKVSLYVSTNGGDTWQGPLKKVIGDVGDKITSGNRNISWNVLEEFDELRGDKIMFQVRASGEYIETVVIGSQEWTKRNLNVSKYRNGDIIPEVKDPKKWSKLTTGAWCYYNNDIENGEIYGKLYNWYAVSDPRGLAPEGFHVSSKNDWIILQNYIVSILKGKGNEGWELKERGSLHWKDDYFNKINSDGYEFKALPGLDRDSDGSFNIQTQGMFANFWNSSTNEIGTLIDAIGLKYDSGSIKFFSEYDENIGKSVRLIKD